MVGTIENGRIALKNGRNSIEIGRKALKNGRN